MLSSWKRKDLKKMMGLETEIIRKLRITEEETEDFNFFSI